MCEKGSVPHHVLGSVLDCEGGFGFIGFYD